MQPNKGTTPSKLITLFKNQLNDKTRQNLLLRNRIMSLMISLMPIIVFTPFTLSIYFYTFSLCFSRFVPMFLNKLPFVWTGILALFLTISLSANNLHILNTYSRNKSIFNFMFHLFAITLYLSPLDLKISKWKPYGRN